VALLVGAAGCDVDADPAVFVEGFITDANVAVAQGTLVSTVAGGFALRLHLGPRASDAAEVTLRSLSLVNTDGSTTFVPTLAVTTAPAFPVTVNVDSDVQVAVGFAAEDNQVETTVYDQICAAGKVGITGAFDDSLRGAATVLLSPLITPSGC
jgi:hypothetical protein